MSTIPGSCCAICGRAVETLASAYLLTAQLQPHRIAILRWSRTLSAREAARPACSPEHALEIVAHWMVSGRLDLSFTNATRQSQEGRPRLSPRLEHPPESYKPIGELVINRDSVRKLVASDPEALASVLDSLLEALLRDRDPVAKKPSIITAGTRQANIA